MAVIESCHPLVAPDYSLLRTTTDDPCLSVAGIVSSVTYT